MQEAGSWHNRPFVFAQELSRKGLAAADVDAALRDVFGESMRLDLDFSEAADDLRPARPDGQFGAKPPMRHVPYYATRNACCERTEPTLPNSMACFCATRCIPSAAGRAAIKHLHCGYHGRLQVFRCWTELYCADL